MNRFVPVAVTAALIVAAIVILLVVSDEDDGEAEARAFPTVTSQQPTPSPNPTVLLFPSPVPSDTPVPLPTLEPTEGTLVYRLNGNLWLAALDGSSEPRWLTEGALNVGVAGHVRHADGTVDLYYIAQLSEERIVRDAPVSEQALFRVPLGGGDPEELLLYTGRNLEPFLGATASVSPDGSYVLYSDEQGISLLDVEAGSTRPVLTRSPPCPGPQDCFSYHRPLWSPDGMRASIAKFFWEGGNDIIIDPFADPIEELGTPGGASFPAQWSPDAERLCVSEFTYAMSGAAIIYDIETEVTVDSTQNLSLPTPEEEGRVPFDSRGCVWADDGSLAVPYVIPNNYSDAWIAFMDEEFQIIHQSKVIEDFHTLVGWLPDGSGVVFNREERRGSRPLQPGVYDFDRGLLSFPFEADRVLAVIP